MLLMLNADSEWDRCLVIAKCHLMGSLPLLEVDSRFVDGKNPLAIKEPPPTDEIDEGSLFLTDMLFTAG